MTANFSAGAVLTAANLNSAINTDTINAQTGAGYTLVLSDAGKTVTLSNASAQTLTIPTNATVAFATGTVIEVLNIGAGTWTVGGAGVTINGTTSIPNKGGVRLLKTATDTWWAAAVDAAVGRGLTYITSSTFSAATTVSVNNCFTSTYDNYRIMLLVTASSTSSTISFRMRASASDNTTSNYIHQALYLSGSTNTASRIAAANTANVGYTGTNALTTIDIASPALSSPTRLACLSAGSDGADTSPFWYLFSSIHNVSSPFDGITFSPGFGANTITGTVTVFGYSKS